MLRWAAMWWLNSNVIIMQQVKSWLVSLKSTWYYRGVLNASYLAVGNFISRIISFVGFIYIARYLGPHDYGIYVTVGAFVGMFEIFMLQGLSKALIREGSKDLESMRTYLESAIGIRNILILLAIVLCIISTFFTTYEVQTKLFILLFSSELAYKGLRGFLGTIYQASEQMHYLSFFGIMSTSLFVLLAILFLKLGYGLLSLFLVALFAHFATLTADFVVARKIVSFKFFSKIQFDKNLLKPAIIFSFLGFIGFFVSRIDLVMISWLGTASDVGVYGVAYKIVQQGEMLRNVNAMAFFPIFVKLFHQQKIASVKLLKYSGLLMVGVFLITVIASIFIENLILLLFGADYQKSGEILRVLMFCLAFSWASLPFTTAAQATHNEKYLIIPIAFMGLVNVPLNYFLFKQIGVIGIAYSTLVVYFTGSILYALVTLKVMKKWGYLI